MFNAKKYTHTHDWITRSELRRNLHRFLSSPDDPRCILEIGSYEGLSACYFSDEWLNHPDSKLFCVDPFDLGDVTTDLTTETETNFRANIARSKNASKITLFKMYSRNFYAIQNQRPSVPIDIFDIIYIDGSHLPADIIMDMTQCYRLLKPGGIMWMDDYHFGKDGSVKRAMDDVLETLTGYSVIHRDYQLGIQKHLSSEAI